MTVFVCRHCLKEGTVREAVTLHGCSHAVEVRPSESDDKPRAYDAARPERAVSWDSLDGEGFYCTHCESEATRLENLVTARPLFECRACGFSGSDPSKHSCPETPERIDPVVVNPGQETLT